MYTTQGKKKTPLCIYANKSWKLVSGKQTNSEITALGLPYWQAEAQCANTGQGLTSEQLSLPSSPDGTFA